MRANWQRVIRDCVIWFLGAIVMPAGCIIILVGLKGSTFHSAVSQGELIVIACAVAGASVAIEMIIGSRSLPTNLYQFGLIFILIADFGFFAVKCKVHHQATDTLYNNNDVRASIVLLIVSAVFGIIAIGRQALLMAEKQESDASPSSEG
jgi:hypothetical protein